MRRNKQLVAAMLVASSVLSSSSGFTAYATNMGRTMAHATIQRNGVTTSTMNEDKKTFTNPMSYTDVPDMDVIRVGDTYYMTSTTMHLSPGCPVMKSKDLVNWEIVNYVYDILEDTDACNLENGESMYSKGQWASSLRYNNGTYYVSFACYTTGKTYIYQTKDIENGSWSKSTIDGVYHDLSLLFDDDGRVYMVYGSGTLKIIELTSDATAIKKDGLNTTLIQDTSGGRSDDQSIIKGEGAHIQKINGKYYISMIGWYINGKGKYADGRMQICFRSDSLTGKYERKEVLNDRGIAQGGLIDTEDGSWYALLFKDSGSVGRIPCLVPVTWDQDWPVLGVDGKVPEQMKIPVEGSDSATLVKSDEFYQGSVHKSYSEKGSIASGQKGKNAELIANGGFEDGINGWRTNGTATLTPVTDEKASGDAAVKVSDRANTTCGPYYDITGQVVEGETYKVSAKVKYTTGPDTKTFNMCIKVGGSWSSNYNPVTVMKSVTAKKGEWATISGTYTIPQGADLSTTGVFVETSFAGNPDKEKDLMDFYVDDVSVKGQSVSDGGNEHEYNGSNLDMVWQWNHNPDNTSWSLTEREGYLRLKNGSLAKGIHDAKNTLTQRTFGPECSGAISMDTSHMKNGDVAGLSAFQYYYGFVGVKMENNKKQLVMKKMVNENGQDVEKEMETVDCKQDVVYLKTDYDFTNNKDQAYFYYSYDGVNWTKIGDALQMSYSLKHFMGYRFGLFNYATKATGGYVDIDYFHVSDKMTGTQSAAKILNASMQNQTVIYQKGSEISVPVTLDAVNGSNLEASVSIPEGFEVSGVDFNGANIIGETSYEANKNGQLLLKVSGEQVAVKDSSKPFVTVKMKGTKDIAKNTVAKVKVDYVDVTGEDVAYNVSKAEANITLTWFDKDSIGKKIGTSNPLITQKYGADPYALVYNGRVYIYMTSDAYEYDAKGEIQTNSYSSIRTISVISSADMVNWTDHGEIKVGGKDGASKWANNSWAPAVAHKVIDGKDKFFLYYANNASSIGVLSADSPVGPFTDPIGKPLIDRSVPGVKDVVWCFDPAVLVDDDGTGYLYFGGGVDGRDVNNPKTSRVIKLGDDMISTVGTAEEIEAPAIFEDSGIHKYNGTYYYSYCSNFSEHKPGYPGGGIICYMTSKSPMGPFEYQGEILDNPGSFFGAGGNNHHAVFEFNNQWYITYHAQTLGTALGIEKGYRSTHINKVEYNEDGTIKRINADLQGVSSIANISPYQRQEAETIAWNSGIKTKEINTPGSLVASNNLALTDINAGDWTAVSNVDFGKLGPAKFTANVASEKGGTVEIHLDSVDGEVIGKLEVGATGGADVWKEVSCNTNKVTGVHNVFFTFMGNGAENLFDMDYWKFEEAKKPEVEVASVTLNKTQVSMAPGEEVELKATVLPGNATNAKVEWETSNNKVATVVDGKVKAIGEGKATITVKAGKKQATCEVEVKAVPVKAVLVDRIVLFMTRGQQKSLDVSVVPNNATHKNIVWKSSNTKVATVDQNGDVTGKKPGIAVITATVDGKSSSCMVFII